MACSSHVCVIKIFPQTYVARILSVSVTRIPVGLDRGGCGALIFVMDFRNIDSC